MRFADPLWFLLLIPLAVWIFCEAKFLANRKAALPYPDLSLLGSRLRSKVDEDQILRALKLAALVLMIVALARPQKVLPSKEPPQPVVDILLCLDTSLSMSALDFDPDNRLEAAKKAAEEFIQKRPFDRIGLVAFGGKAITQCPLTLDHESLADLLGSVPLNATQSDGTAIGTAIALAAGQLAQSQAKSKVVILLTDGRNNTGSLDPLTAARTAAELGVKIYTIGCAVPGGGLMPVQDPLFGKRLVRTQEDLDEPALLEIATATGAQYFRVTSSKRFKEIYDRIDRMEKTKVETSAAANYSDLYLPPLLTAAGLLVLAFFLNNTVWRTVP